MKCQRCNTQCDALFEGGLCLPCWQVAEPAPAPAPHVPRPEMPQPREFAEITPEVRLAHIGHWMSFYVAGLRIESPHNPGLSARRSASLADAALGRLLKCIPQLARPAEEDINPIANQRRCECELCSELRKVSEDDSRQLHGHPPRF